MAGWFYIVSIVLVGAGIAKIRDPAPTAGAMAAFRLPSSQPVVFALAGAEVGAGCLAIVSGGRPGGALIAAFYGAFAVFVGAALASDRPVQSCGCFGRDDTPPSRLHVAYNVSAAIAGVAFAVTDGAALLDVLGDQPAFGLPFVAFLIVGAAASYLLLDELPRLHALVKAA